MNNKHRPITLFHSFGWLRKHVELRLLKYLHSEGAIFHHRQEQLRYKINSIETLTFAIKIDLCNLLISVEIRMRETTLNPHVCES